MKFQWNIFRSPLGDYCDELGDNATAYAPEVLERIRADGFNAIWIKVVLRKIVATNEFPEFTPKEGALENLRDLVERCREAELGLFLYLNEPFGLPEEDDFWRIHPELRGHLDRSFDDGWDRANALCTSQPATLRFLEEASSTLFSAVPDLAGVILITASEHLTHCFSHESKFRQRSAALEPGQNYPLTCPRCAERKPWDLVGEVVTAIQRGVRSASKSASIIAWNWSWTYFEGGRQSSLLAALPEGVDVMIDFERGGSQELELQNRKISIDVDEYSLGYAGPSEAFERVADEARGREMSVLAKLQIGTTHEISTVPNLPLIPNLVAKLRYLEAQGARGCVATWCFGTYASLNTFAVGWTLSHSKRDDRATLEGIANAYFPGSELAEVVGAWEGFCQAFQWFPQVQDFLYAGPVNAAPAYPWEPQFPSVPMRPSWFPPLPYGNVLDACLGPLTSEELVETLGTHLQVWDGALVRYERGLSGCHRPEATLEWGVAKMIGCQLRSTRNLFSFHRAQTRSDWNEVTRLIAAEIRNLQAALPLVESDARLGYHQGCFPRPQVFYDGVSIRKKIEALQVLQDNPSSLAQRED